MIFFRVYELGNGFILIIKIDFNFFRKWIFFFFSRKVGFGGGLNLFFKGRIIV